MNAQVLYTCSVQACSVQACEKVQESGQPDAFLSGRNMALEPCTLAAIDIVPLQAQAARPPQEQDT